MNEIIFYILVAYGALASFAFVMYLPKIFGMRYGFRKPPYKRAAEKRNIAVIIPARRESAIIGDLFASLERQTYDRAHFSVNVIVKDADDPTIGLCEKIGARAFVVSEQTCKGDALDGFFHALTKEEIAAFDAFVIVDADAVLAPDYIAELNNALEHDYDIYLTRKFAKNYLGDRKNRSLFSNCSALTWPMIDDLGNLYRMQKDMPLTLCGQGMMVRRKVIETIGGWPYRTLTEDYELKLDSLLHGFTSMFYPYAVIYTEEALGHKENFRRRMRWLTGYSQCDKKYKRQIREKMKQEGADRGIIEYFFGLFPLLLFAATTIITMLAGAGLAIYYALARDINWFYASWMLVFMPFWIMYLLLFIYSLIAMCSDLEAFRALSKGERFAMLLFNPLYLLEYIPLYISSVHHARKNTSPAWRETERLTYEGEDVASRAARAVCAEEDREADGS